MFKKMLPWLIMVFVVITLLVLGGFVLWEFIMKDNTPLDADSKTQDIVEQVETITLSAKDREQFTYHINDVTTNLSDMNYIAKISFSFVLENKKTREEIEYLTPQVLDIIGNILADTSPDDIVGSSGRDVLKAKIINRISPRLNEGSLMEISISDFILTRR